MTRTRVGFIGAGGIAIRHLNDLIGFPDVRIAAFADPNTERANYLAKHVGANAYSDYRQMLDGEELEAVYVCTPPFTHGEPELDLIARELPFFVEKPLATTWETARQIAGEVEKQGLITAVGYQWRYLDITERAQELVRGNPARLLMGYWLDATPPPPWWRRQAESGGQMVEQTTHIFDLARVLGGEITEVHALGSRTDRQAFPQSDIHDVTTAALRFASGAVGSVTSTCVLRGPHRIGLHVFCEGMALELSERELMVDLPQGRGVQPAQVDAYIREDRDFIDAVQGKENRIRAPYSEALLTHRVTTAAVQSIEEQRPIRLGDAAMSLAQRITL